MTPRIKRKRHAALLTVSLTAALLLCSCSRRGTRAQAPEPLNCAVFPPGNIWNTAIDKLPVDANSASFIAAIGPSKSLHPDFGSRNWNGAPLGIPYVLVPASQPKNRVAFDYSAESDAGPYPIPPSAPIEGGNSGRGDRHVIVVDKENCVLYELFGAYPTPHGDWRAGSGAIFDLKSDTLRPAGWTSADAAGLPVFPGLIRYDEVAAGEIRHALRFTAPRTRKEFIWPATHQASRLTDRQFPPMGQRFRLKANFDVSPYSSEVRVVLIALKKYGMFLSDNGSPWFLSGTPDARWNDRGLREFRGVRGSDFEAVDESLLKKDSGSAEVSHT